ncbi:hypothetical protein SNE26_23900 [Mucilaginibacter sp. cycad4]|uniref:hypothetical protein n=1 Tax=Mucilaginibacter sp. cycad4 TaxID=3342096 RepID=UPI002AAAA9C1|nr:hypothetical protein [Mucilaginibacter gossypii]WPU99060.1 hypothetical protein SNE26_23900 [Mucilaginibacter gossypii]
MEFIGEGAIWTVNKLDNQNEIFRIPKGVSDSTIEKFIINHRIIKELGLPTLKKVEKRSIGGISGIVCENLNTSEDKIYVSPNSLYSESQQLAYALNKGVLTHKERLESLAEEFRYRNKIAELTNFREFLITMGGELALASRKNVLIEFDSYFFGTQKHETISALEYKIADLDHIFINEDLDYSELFDRNCSEFKRAMSGFIKYFVSYPNDDDYKDQLNRA